MEKGRLNRWTELSHHHFPCSARHPGLPGGGGQCNEQGLKDTADEDNRVLFGDEEVEQGQDEEAVDHQPAHYSDRVETQLFSNGCGVIHLQDLAGNEEHNTKGEIPVVGAGGQLSAKRVRVPDGPGRTSLPGLIPLSLP